MPKPRVALVYDKESTPFRRIAGQLRKALSRYSEFSLYSIDSLPSEAEFDVVVGLSPRSLSLASSRIIAHAGIACVYDNVTWRSDESIGMADVVCCANKRIADDVSRGAPVGVGVPVLVCEDGVDTDVFYPRAHQRGRLVGWSGGRQAFKGFGIYSAAVRPDLQSVATCLPHSDMPSWYNSLARFVCTSAHEGTPNTILEALACGVPVISTLVGVVPELLEQGADITVIPRTVEGLRAVGPNRPGRMSSSSAALMVERWDWKHKVLAWKTAIDAALEACGSRARLEKRQAASSYRVSSAPRVKLLCVADQRDWAFDVNERAMSKYMNRRGIDCDFAYVEDKRPLFGRGYSAAFAPYHRWPSDLVHGLFEVPVFGSCRSDRIDIDRPEFVGDSDFEWFDACSAIHGCTRSSSEWLRGLFGRKVCYLTNPVDTEVFTASPDPKGAVIALWAGNPNHGMGKDHKGVRIIRQACSFPRIRLIEANYETHRMLPRDMPEFYRQGNVYVCASLYEGASNSIMEAMACGCLLVSTDVGNVREIRDSQICNQGHTGIFIVDRNPAAISTALYAIDRMSVEERLYLRKLNQIEIRERWSWERWAPAYAAQIRRIACR